MGYAALAEDAIDDGIVGSLWYWSNSLRSERRGHAWSGWQTHSCEMTLCLK